MADVMGKIAGWRIEGFGSSDCSCSSHVFGMEEDPLRTVPFISLLQYFRIDRLMGAMGNEGS